MRNVRMLVAGCLFLGLPAAHAAEPPFPLATAQRHTVSQEQVLDGVLEAVNEATLSAQTSGRIVEIFFDVDDFVPAGSVIMRLRDTEQRARLKQAEANASEAEARYNEAQTDFARVKDVFEKGLVSKAQRDSAQAALKAAEARLDAARAGLTQAQEQLEYTRVRAPYSGIVRERHVQVGETANVGQPLMTGISLDFLRATVDVPQRLINPVRQYNQARVLLDGETVAATQLTFFPYADPKTNTFKVRVVLPEGVKGLFPGMFTKVAFTVGEAQRLVVPAEAVVYRSEVSGVYVYRDDGSVALRQVRLGHKNGTTIEILAGLDEGETVALDPIRAGVYAKEHSARLSGVQGGVAHE